MPLCLRHSCICLHISATQNPKLYILYYFTFVQICTPLMSLSCELWRTLRSTPAARDSDSHTDSDAAIFPDSCFLIQPFLCQPCAPAQQTGDGCGCLTVSQQSSSHATSKWCTLCATTRPIISHSKRPSPVASPATPKDRASPGPAPGYPCQFRVFVVTERMCMG